MDKGAVGTILEWHVDAGVDETLADTPVNRFELAEEPDSVATAKKAASRPPKKMSERVQTGPGRDRPVLAEKTPDSAPRSAASEIAAAAKTLEDLENAIRGFDGCSLKRTAMNTVFADGNPGARIMLVGEAPGADEDRQGKPFVGLSGRLLDKIMGALDWVREKDYYISNILPWRPPGNRKPSPIEVGICLPFIYRHIELAKPDVVIALGGTAAAALLDSSSGITRLRGKWSEAKIGKQAFAVLPTYHPAYLLRQPRLKGDVWKDFLSVKAKLE